MVYPGQNVGMMVNEGGWYIGMLFTGRLVWYTQVRMLVNERLVWYTQVRMLVCWLMGGWYGIPRLECWYVDYWEVGMVCPGQNVGMMVCEGGWYIGMLVTGGWYGIPRLECWYDG